MLSATPTRKEPISINTLIKSIIETKQEIIRSDAYSQLQSLNLEEIDKLRPRLIHLFKQEKQNQDQEEKITSQLSKAAYDNIYACIIRLNWVHYDLTHHVKDESKHMISLSTGEITPIKSLMDCVNNPKKNATYLSALNYRDLELLEGVNINNSEITGMKFGLKIIPIVAVIIFFIIPPPFNILLTVLSIISTPFISAYINKKLNAKNDKVDKNVITTAKNTTEHAAQDKIDDKNSTDDFKRMPITTSASIYSRLASPTIANVPRKRHAARYQPAASTVALISSPSQPSSPTSDDLTDDELSPLIPAARTLP